MFNRVSTSILRRGGALALAAFLLSCGAPGGDDRAGTAGAALTSPAVVYYYLPYKGWSQAYIHHNASGTWTAVPGQLMTAACTGWVTFTLSSSATSFQAVFDNGAGAWDNPTGGGNYTVAGGISVVQNGKLTANAANPCTTPPPPSTNSATVFYQPPTSWTAVDIHYGINGTWTTPPGVAMDAACTGWKKKTISLGAATSFQATFNNGSGTWDNNGGANYTLGTGTSTVSGGKVTANAADPCGGTIVDTTPPSVPAGVKATASGTSITVTWTASTDNVGVTGYEVTRTGGTQGTVVATTTGTSFIASGLTASTTYAFTVKAYDAAGNKSAASAAASATTPAPTTGNTATVFYANTSSWANVNIHYGVNGTWTTPPGVAMTLACSGWYSATVNMGATTTMMVDFNNGSTWDNNNGANYTVGTGLTTVKSGVVTANAASPCVPDTTPPTVPAGVAATVSNGVNVLLTWTASTDNVAVTGYTVTRSGGTQGTVTLSAYGTSYSDLNLSATTTYSYTVKAYDLAGNVSAASAPVSVTTGTAPPPPPPPAAGQPLGGDPRADSIYFVMTARFYDGDSTNDRGGNQDVKSGNAANHDPMFRGDFKGLIQKLDYIKALGFSAIWITPVILNRSDYDYHGYHGWDFYRVDPRLESPGATYGDLINAAHAKGIKIIQDVVYNHSCRWGAKGLWTTKAFGLRDSQWSWYYDNPVPGFEYDGLTIDPNTGKSYYNGDLWSTPEPPGNTCRSWGVQTQWYSPEGYKIYNCQWPDPTSGMFPPAYYHQCWIGNWEGEDSRSCWLAGDLADFNTENATVQAYLENAYNHWIDLGVDGFRVDTAVHVPRVTWNRRYLPALQQHATSKWGAKGNDFFVFGEVGAFVNDKWNRGSVNHSAQFFTWKERKAYTADDVQASLDQYNYEEQLGTGNQPTSTNAFLVGNAYHAPDHSQFSGMNIIDMRMHMNFGTASNAFWNGKDSDDSVNDATYNVVYVESHDYGPNKSTTAYAGGTNAWAENMSLMWTFRGIPTLFQGSEIEFQAGKTIDCGPTCPLATTRRAYFGSNLEGSVTAADFGVVGSASGTVATTLNYPLVKHVQRLNQIRRRIPALQKGQYSTADISGNSSNMAFKRRFTDAAAGVDSFVLVTISSGATFASIPNGTYKDAITGDVQTVTNGTLTATASGQGNMRIYVLDLPGNPAPGKIGVDGPFLRP